MKLKPLDDRIVIKQSDAQEKTAGGIILPDSAKEKPQIGKIVAAGPGKLLENGKRAAMSVKKNDEVLYAKYMGNDVEVDGQTYVILKESPDGLSRKEIKERFNWKQGSIRGTAKLLKEHDSIKCKQGLSYLYITLMLVFVLPFVGFLVYCLYGGSACFIFCMAIVSSCALLGRHFDEYRLRLLELKRMGVDIE